MWHINVHVTAVKKTRNYFFITFLLFSFSSLSLSYFFLCTFSPHLLITFLSLFISFEFYIVLLKEHYLIKMREKIIYVQEMSRKTFSKTGKLTDSVGREFLLDCYLIFSEKLYFDHFSCTTSDSKLCLHGQKGHEQEKVSLFFYKKLVFSKYYNLHYLLLLFKIPLNVPFILKHE